MSDNSNGCFWTFIIVFFVSLFSHSQGREYQNNINRDQRRDEEMEELKRQIIALKSKRY